MNLNDFRLLLGLAASDSSDVYVGCLIVSCLLLGNLLASVILAQEKASFSVHCDSLYTSIA